MKQCMSFAKGMGWGIVAGVTLATTVKCVCAKSKKFKRKTHNAARAVSDIMENIQDLLR